MEKTGIKLDQNKPQWTLVPWEEMEEVAKVLCYGADKYSKDNWKKVPDSRSRYFSAALRHIIAWHGGIKNDSESGLSHLAHAVCCLLFLMWHDKQDDHQEHIKARMRYESMYFCVNCGCYPEGAGCVKADLKNKIWYCPVCQKENLLK